MVVTAGNLGKFFAGDLQRGLSLKFVGIVGGRWRRRSVGPWGLGRRRPCLRRGRQGKGEETAIEAGAAASAVAPVAIVAAAASAASPVAVSASNEEAAPSFSPPPPPHPTQTSETAQYYSSSSSCIYRLEDNCCHVLISSHQVG